MKVLLVTDTYAPHVNGTAIFVYRLAQDLALAGHKVYVAGPSRKFGHERYIHEGGVEVFGVPSFPVLNYPFFRMTTMIFSTCSSISLSVNKCERSPDKRGSRLLVPTTFYRKICCRFSRFLGCFTV